MAFSVPRAGGAPKPHPKLAVYDELSRDIGRLMIQHRERAAGLADEGGAATGGHEPPHDPLGHADETLHTDEPHENHLLSEDEDEPFRIQPLGPLARDPSHAATPGHQPLARPVPTPGNQPKPGLKPRKLGR